MWINTWYSMLKEVGIIRDFAMYESDNLIIINYLLLINNIIINITTYY